MAIFGEVPAVFLGVIYIGGDFVGIRNLKKSANNSYDNLPNIYFLYAVLPLLRLLLLPAAGVLHIME